MWVGCEALIRGNQNHKLLSSPFLEKAPLLLPFLLLALTTKSFLPSPAAFFQALHSNFIAPLPLSVPDRFDLLPFSSLSVLWPFSAEDAHFRQGSHPCALRDYHRTAKSAERIREAGAADRRKVRES